MVAPRCYASVVSRHGVIEVLYHGAKRCARSCVSTCMYACRFSSVLVLAAACSLQLAAQTPAPTIAERFLLAAANQDRVARGLPQLHFDDHLALAARLHAYEMAKRRTISHQFPGEQDLAARAGEAGAHFSLVTENVAEAPNSAEIHDLWMNSEGHRANLLDPNVDSVGIAVIQSRGEFYAVEDFAHTVQHLSLTDQEAAVSDLIARSGLRLEPSDEDARQTCQLSSGFAGSRQPGFVMRYTSSDIHRLPDQLSSRIATGRYREAVVGACVPQRQTPFTSYSIAVLLFP